MLDNRSFQFQDYIGYIFPNDLKEKYDIKTFTFQVTEECNLCCSYCYQTNKTKTIMSFDVAKKMIDYIFNNISNQNFYFCEQTTKGIIIDFIGGEPLLEIELIEKIIEYFELKIFNLPPDHPWVLNHMYSMSSNGTLYFSEKFQQLRHKYPDLISISITVDGNKELHDKCRLDRNGNGSYDRAMSAALHNLKFYNGKGTKITLSPDNISYTSDAVINMLQHGFEYIFINPVYEEGWNDSHGTILYDELKKLSDWIYSNNYQDKCWIRLFEEHNYLPATKNDNWCGSTTCMLALNYKGDIFPCIRFMNSSLNNEQPELKIGNIETGLFTTEEEKKILQELDSITRTSQSSEECNNCSINGGCSWCTGYNYQKFGTMNKRATFICPVHIASALGTIYFYQKENKEYNKIKVNKEQALRIISLEEYNKLINQ